MRLQDVTLLEISATDENGDSRRLVYRKPAVIRAMLTEDSSLGDLLRDLVLSEPTRKVPGVQ